MIFRQKTALTLCALVGLLLAARATTALAESDWALYRSQGGMYETKIHAGFKTALDRLRIAPHAVVHSEQISATVDQRPYVNAVKNYIVKAYQSPGTDFTPEEAEILLEADIKFYVDDYAKMKGRLKSKADIKNSYSMPMKEIFIAYEDPNLGPQAARIRLAILGKTKYSQSLTGPEDSLFSHESKAFFDDMKFREGVAAIEGSFEQEWKEFVSPLGIFTALLPAGQSIYYTEKPLIEKNGHIERMSFTFKDPVRHQNLYYRIYGYRTDVPLGSEYMQKLLSIRHVKQHGPLKEPPILIAGTLEDGLIRTIKTEFRIPPKKSAPYVNMVKLYGQALGHYMIVHEFIGSPELVASPFVETLIPLTKFHPEKAEDASAPATSP